MREGIMSREEAAGEAVYDKAFHHGLSGTESETIAEAALAAADAHDAATGVHRVTLDAKTIERAARALIWRIPELDLNPAAAMDHMRYVLAAAVKEGQ